MGCAQTTRKVEPDRTFTARLNQLLEQNATDELFRVVNNPQTDEQLKAALDWMKPRAFTQRDPKYLFSYSALLSQARIVDTAVATYMAGNLVARVEATRCMDQSGTRKVLDGLQGRWKDFEDVYWALPVNVRRSALDMALLVEDTRSSNTTPIAWLCPPPTGMGAIHAAMKPAAAGEPRTKVVEKGNQIDITVDTRGLSPEFLSYEQTLPERRRAIEAFTRYYAQENRPNRK